VASSLILNSKIILLHHCFGETRLVYVVYGKIFLTTSMFLMWNLEGNKLWQYKVKSWQPQNKVENVA
jgi:drug/metabolite transporter superfamily protein YnfA